nr:MAG TPA: hypothetical protein [Caudoviricetes sp.]
MTKLRLRAHHSYWGLQIVFRTAVGVELTAIFVLRL